MGYMFAGSRPRAVWVRLLAGALLAICALCLFSAQRAAAASWPFSESASGLKYPYTLGSNGAGVNDTACGQTNQCVSVGYIFDSLNNEQAYVDPIVDGVPQAGVQVTLPADAATSPQAYLSYVSCQGDGSCTAVGYYNNQSSVTVPMVVQITNGTPATAVAITEPTNSVAGNATFNGLSCPTSGTCVAVGYDQSSTTTADEPWLVTFNAGTPTASQFVAPPSNDDSSDPGASFSGVACQASGNCEAVGSYSATSSDYREPMAVAISGSVGSAVEVSLPADAAQTSSPNASLSAIGCPASGACEAMGTYLNSSNVEESVAVPITGGAPGTPTTATPPAGYETGFAYGGADGLSCSSASMCVAAGYYYNTSGNAAPAVAVITGSGATWSATPLPADVSSTGTFGYLGEFDGKSVACVPSGPCLATGWYYTSYGSNTYSGLEQTVSASGELGAAQVGPAPSDTAAPQNSYLYAGPACVSAGSCVVGGQYENTSSTYLPYEVSEQAPLSVTTTSLPAGSQHAAYDSTLAATGAWGVYTWAVSSGTLPPGLTLNSESGRIFGTPTTAGTFSFTVQVTGTGASIPTATQSFSVTIAAVPPVIRILGHTGLVKGNRLGVKLACSKWDCAGTVKVETRITVKHGKKRVRRMVVIGSAHYSLGQGKTRVLSVKLNSAGRRALAMAKTHHVSVTILATVNGGKPASHNEKIWTAAKKKKRK